MVSAISSSSQNINLQDLEIIRRLQSLGINPSGNTNADRQILQKAEYQKIQSTLAQNTTKNLSSLEGTGLEFSDTLNSLSKINPTKNIKEATDLNEKTFINQLTIDQISTNIKNPQNKYNNEYNKTGAMQLAELNKLKLGLT